MSLEVPSAAWWRRREIPTWIVAVAIYASWAALIVFNRHIPWPLLMLAGGYVLAWHFSLQHEAIHVGISRRRHQAAEGTSRDMGAG